MKKNQPLTEEQIKEYKELKQKYFVEGKNLTRSEKKLFRKYNIQSNKDRIHELRQKLEHVKKHGGYSWEKSDIRYEIEKLNRETFNLSHPTMRKIINCITGTGEVFTDIMSVSKESAKERKEDFMYMQLMIDD